MSTDHDYFRWASGILTEPEGRDMNISEDKKSRLYEAIHEPTMKTRIRIRNGLMSTNQIDDLLFDLNAEIWSEVKSVLNLKD